jgi:hypothetical protein
MVYRLQHWRWLEEVNFDAPVVPVGRIWVALSSLEASVCRQNPAHITRARFLLSQCFGLAFDPTEPPRVVAPARGCLEQWEAQ